MQAPHSELEWDRRKTRRREGSGKGRLENHAREAISGEIMLRNLELLVTSAGNNSIGPGSAAKHRTC